MEFVRHRRKVSVQLRLNIYRVTRRLEKGSIARAMAHQAVKAKARLRRSLDSVCTCPCRLSLFCRPSSRPVASANVPVSQLPPADEGFGSLPNTFSKVFFYILKTL